MAVASSLILSPALLLAQETSTEAPPKEEEVIKMLELYVKGRGETRATSVLTKVDIDAGAPGQEPLLALRRLPGITVEMSDALGLYEFGASVRLRAFDLTQIAFDVDGVPMGRNDARGNRVSRFVENETIESVTLSQGSGDVSTPAYSALGGAIHYTTVSPSMSPGALATVSFGDDSLLRTFVKVDSGEFFGGTTAFISASRTSADVSVGPGTIDRDHVEAKVQRRIGNFTSTLSYRYNDRFDNDVFSISLGEFYATGRETPVLFSGFTGDPDTDVLNYEKWVNGRVDHLINWQWDGQVTESLRLKFNPYFQNQRGLGTAWEVHGNDANNEDPNFPGPRRLMGREEIMKDNRWGVTGRAELVFSNHTLAAGFWYEHEKYSRHRQGYELLANRDLDKSAPVYSIYYHSINSDVYQFYVEDKIKLLDERLTLSIGAKSLTVERDFKGVPNTGSYFAGEYFRRSKTFEDNFTPQVGATYDVTGSEQVFVNYAQNFSVPAFNFFTGRNYDPNVRAETSENWDLGVRTTRGKFDASLTGYFIKYKDRTLEIADPSERYLVADAVLQNVGDVETKGIEAAMGWNPLKVLRLSTSFTYTDSKFQDDYFDGDTLVPVKGRHTPEVPEFQLQASADYKPREGLNLGLDMLTVDRRYGTTVNDEWLGGYTVFNARLGAVLAKDVGPMKKLEAKVIVENILDKEYLAFPDSLYVSGPAYYYPGSPRKVYFTLSASF